MYGVPYCLLADQNNRQSVANQCVHRPFLADISDDTRPCRMLRSNAGKRVGQAFSPKRSS